MVLAAGVFIGVSDSVNAQITCFDCTYCGAGGFSAIGFDGVRATIEVVPTTTNPSPHVLAWCGLDWNQVFWIQTGWIAYGATRRAYIEYVTELGIPGGTEPGGAITGEYAILRNNERLYVTIYGLLYGNYYWASFDAHPMCKLYVGAEMKGATQHVPGEPSPPSSHCDITNVQSREFAFGSFFTPLLATINTSQCGLVTFLGSGGLSIWDSRTLNQGSCPP